MKKYQDSYDDFEKNYYEKKYILNAGYDEAENKKTKNKKNSNFLTVILVVFLILIYGLISFMSAMIFLKNSNVESELILDFPFISQKKPEIEIADDSQRPYVDLSILWNSNHFTTYTPKEIFKNNCNSVVGLSTKIKSSDYDSKEITYTSGTGFFISSNGYIVTNFHVIEESLGNIFVTTYDGKTYKAIVVGYEEKNDLAVLKIDGKNFIPVTFGSLQNMEIGDEVLCIGHPLGILDYSMTRGILSAMDRTIGSVNMFQTDCAINSGNSGGPLFNIHGEVIGITTAKYTSDEIEGLGFCIPIDDIYDYTQQIIEFGKVKYKPYLGIGVITVSATAAEEYNLTEGIYVESVTKGSCAEKAGINVGDVIVQFGQYNTKESSDLGFAKKQFRAGDSVEVIVWRNGEYIPVLITLDNELEIDYLKTNETHKIDETLNEWYNEYFGYNK